jgi:hypothetical protein
VAVTVIRTGGCGPPGSEPAAAPTTAATAVTATPATVSTTHGHKGHRGCDVGMSGSSPHVRLRVRRHDCRNRYVFATSNAVNMCWLSCFSPASTVVVDFGRIARKHRGDG